MFFLTGCVLLTHCTQPVTDPADIPIFKPVFSANQEEVRTFLAKAQGGANAKLVYVDRTKSIGELDFVDFSEAGPPKIKVVAAAKNPTVPVLSPDGKWVVYGVGTGCEAGSMVTNRCSVYLSELSENAKPVLIARDSACEPRFMQNTTKLTVIYSTLAPNYAWEGFGKAMKVEVDVAGALPLVGTPTILFGAGSYTAGLSWDGRYLGGGGGHVALLDIQGTKLRPDTITLGTQGCNASISSSRNATNTLMYLNTTGSHALVNGGKVWGEWEAILISNSLKQLVKGYMFPASPVIPLETVPPSFTKAKWHHSEWSNHPYFGVATLNAERYFESGGKFINTGFQERIYLINLKDSSYLEVLRPDKVAYSGREFGGFFWPWLWIQVPNGFVEDPAWLNAKP